MNIKIANETIVNFLVLTKEISYYVYTKKVALKKAVANATMDLLERTFVIKLRVSHSFLPYLSCVLKFFQA